MTSQAFLFAAYFAIVNSDTFKAVKCQLLYTIATVGGAMTLTYTVSIFAAFLAIREWRDSADTDPKDKLVSQPFIHFCGDMPAAISGALILAVWGVLAREERTHFSELDSRTLIMPWVFMFGALVVWGRFGRSIFSKSGLIRQKDHC